jgi:hypothetical protein
MVALQRLQADGKTWYTLRTFETANHAWLWLGKVNERKWRVVKV